MSEFGLTSMEAMSARCTVTDPASVFSVTAEASSACTTPLTVCPSFVCTKVCW